MNDNKIRVWTKQSRTVWELLQQNGVHHARKHAVKRSEEANLVLVAYDWLAKHTPGAKDKPEGAEYPIWVSFSHEGVMLPTPNTVVLELEVDPGLLTPVNIAKWGAILNYSYIPKDEKDHKRHLQLLNDYNTNDARAFMTPFYPQIKREIEESWIRLFDDSIQLGSPACYGNLWEVKKEWVIRVTE